MQRFIGFYWTLPVPWAGFRDLPTDPDAAAEASRTIRYQRDRVRQWVRQEKGTLIEERVFIELQADRGSPEIVPAIDALLETCQAMSARLVLVDFSQAYGWRPHGPLSDRLAGNDLCMQLDPEAMRIDGEKGESFNPVAHFRMWREMNDAHVASKPQRKARIAEAIAALQTDHQGFEELAKALNAAETYTLSGKPWTGDNVRKFLRGR